MPFGHIQSRFRRISAVFRPVSAVSTVSAAGRYDSIWPIRLYFGQISSVRRRLKPIRHELSRIGANRAESAQIREKKKKNADAVRQAGNCVGRRVRAFQAGIQQWWNNFLVRFRHIFDKVYKFKNNHLYVHKEQSSTLPLFIRNVHHHYAERGKRQVVMFFVFYFDHFDFDFDFFFPIYIAFC